MMNRNDNDSDYVIHNTQAGGLTQNKKVFGSKTKVQYQSLKFSN